MKVLGYILTAAAVLIGADIFVMSSDPSNTSMVTTDAPMSYGEGGMPTPPPD